MKRAKFAVYHSMLYLLIILTGATASAFPVDFDGDGKTDAAVFRPSFGDWYILASSGICPNGWNIVGVQGQCQRQWGLPGDIPLVGDFDVDGKGDLTVYRPSNYHFYTLYSFYTTVPYSVAYQFPDGTGSIWPSAGDLPSVGDVNGDNRSDVSIYRPTGGSATTALSVARVYTSSPPAITQYHNFLSFQLSTLHPVSPFTRDYSPNFSNPSGVNWGDEISIGYASAYIGGIFGHHQKDIKFPAGAGFQTIRNPLANYATIKPVSGTFSGSAPGMTGEPAYFDTATGVWTYLSSATGNWTNAGQWGSPGDIPVPGDYDGNG